MKKYLVAALVACLGILSVNAQVDKTIEVSQCEANNKLTVEGQTLISTSYGNLVIELGSIAILPAFSSLKALNCTFFLPWV